MGKFTDVFGSSVIAAIYNETASNRIPYLGEGFFPAKQKSGLNLKWIKTSKGLPVSLAPSAFDVVAPIRSRQGLEVIDTEMAYFKEAMIVKEQDIQDYETAVEGSALAKEILDRNYDDATTLVESALVVPERMRMQLLAPLGGNMGINVQANGVKYTYNYDPDGSWKREHYMKIATAEDKWSASETCDPIADLEAALDAQEAASGNRPEILLMSKKTFKYMKDSKKVQAGVLAQNTTANVNYTSKRVQAYIEEELNVTLVIYTKKYKNESKVEANFYPDDIIAMLPNGALGKTWYGTTPEERTLAGAPGSNVSIVNTGVAVAVTITNDPVNTKTTVSEIVLPSFERMNECYVLEVAGN